MLQVSALMTAAEAGLVAAATALATVEIRLRQAKERLDRLEQSHAQENPDKKPPE